MDTDETRNATHGAASAPRCLVEGCQCRDPRIVSQRRARFFAHMAAMNGETARRMIRPEPGWQLPRPA